MKFRPAWTMGVVVILVCASLLGVRYIDRTDPQRLASLLGITVTVSDLHQTPSPSPRVTPVGGDQTALLGSVAIQTFLGPTLVRQGPGTAVSSDGLILTTVATAPYGSGSYVYQVATPRGQVLRAYRVASDRASGLVLLKVEATNLEAVLFVDTPASVFFAGAQLEAVASQIQVSTFSNLRLPVWVVGISQDSQPLLSLDRAFGPLFYGARVVDQAQRSVGMLRYGATSSLIHSSTINTFIDAYLARNGVR
jgi:hypothetical protein